MKFSKNIKKTVSFMLAFSLLYGAVTPAITPAQAAEMSYSVIIEPKYQDASYFSEGVAVVAKYGTSHFQNNIKIILMYIQMPYVIMGI